MLENMEKQNIRVRTSLQLQLRQKQRVEIAMV